MKTTYEAQLAAIEKELEAQDTAFDQVRAAIGDLAGCQLSIPEEILRQLDDACAVHEASSPIINGLRG